MPNLDKTGPRSAGPLSGRGLGRCRQGDDDLGGEDERGAGRGRGWGRGGDGRGRGGDGRGRGVRRQVRGGRGQGGRGQGGRGLGRGGGSELPVPPETAAVDQQLATRIEALEAEIATTNDRIAMLLERLSEPDSSASES